MWTNGHFRRTFGFGRKQSYHIRCTFGFGVLQLVNSVVAESRVQSLSCGKVWLRPRHYRLSVSVFGRKSRFTFGGAYGFGRMCYVTFGLLSVSAESKTSAFVRPLVSAFSGDVFLCRILNAQRALAFFIVMTMDSVNGFNSGHGLCKSVYSHIWPAATLMTTWWRWRREELYERKFAFTCQSFCSKCVPVCRRKCIQKTVRTYTVKHPQSLLW